MTTGAIIAIVVVALIVIALLAFMLPRMRAKAQVQKRERELQTRRDRAVEGERAEATTRERQASEAQQRARIAQKEAEAERAQASLHEERAGLHERGMADHELIDDSERERFAGTSAMNGRHDRDGDGVDDRREDTTAEGGTLDSDYDRGRRDEAMDETDRPARFQRDDVAEPAPERRDSPTRY
jgi:multidrug efflux pump subunit AcrA (membrane-fusion protein)